MRGFKILCPHNRFSDKFAYSSRSDVTRAGLRRLIQSKVYGDCLMPYSQFTLDGVRKAFNLKLVDRLDLFDDIVEVDLKEYFLAN
jgi:hypothetical protein